MQSHAKVRIAYPTASGGNWLAPPGRTISKEEHVALLSWRAKGFKRAVLVGFFHRSKNERLHRFQKATGIVSIDTPCAEVRLPVYHPLLFLARIPESKNVLPQHSAESSRSFPFIFVPFLLETGVFPKQKQLPESFWL